jgi:hypothetical protein
LRATLTFIAVVLVVVLSAALVAPLFIDWSSHRAQIEAELSDILGARVVVAGPIDIRFLPTPYLQLKTVTIADGDDGAPAFTCQNVQLEAALASLPSGRARFTLARLDHPELTLSRQPDGSLNLPQWRFKAQPDRVALDRIVVTAGRLVVRGGTSAPFEMDGLDLDATAASLIGPYRGAGRVATPGTPAVEFRFAAAALTEAGLPVKLEFDPAGSLPSGVFDGTLALAPRAGGSGVDLAYSGAATLAGFSVLTESGPPTPWRVSGTLSADFAGAKMDNLVARFGPEERALEATGAAKLEIGQRESLSADLTAKQLNVDSLLREKGDDSVSPARAIAALSRALSPLGALSGSPLALRVAFTAPTVIVGAQSLNDVVLNVTAASGAPIAGDLEMGLPGQSRLRLAGTLELGAAAEFKGRLEARMGDFAQLRDWAARDAPEFAQRLATLSAAAPYRTASATGDVEASAVGFAARNLQLVVDRTALSGAMAFTRAIGEERGRLFMDLRSDALDVDALPNLSASANLLGDLDLSLALEAARLRVARVGEAAIDSGSLLLKATKTGDDLSLDRLSVTGLGGAAVDVRGAWGPKGRWLTLQLDAEKLRDFAALIARVAPGAPSRLLVERADALSPAKATLEARAAGPGVAGVLDSLTAQGSAGKSQFTFRIGRSAESAGGVAATLGVDAPEGAALLRQIGVQAASVASGRAHVEASANGRWDTGFDGRVAASIAGANLVWRGRLDLAAKGEDAAVLFGSGGVKADNVMPLMASLGLAAASDAPVVPVDLSGDFALRGGEVGFPHVAGTLAGAKVIGRLRWRPAIAPVALSSIDPDVALAQSIAGEPQAAPAAQIDGELSLDHASLAALISLPLGATQPAKAGARWSDAGFAPALVDPPPLDVALKVGSLSLVDALQARNASGRLRLDHGRLDIDEFAMDVAEGRATGDLSLRRDGAVATLSGQTSLTGVALDWSSLRGRFGASLTFAGAGRTPSALVAGLVGDGRIETAGMTIARLDPSALARVLAKAQAPDAAIDETNIVHALEGELDRKPLILADASAPAMINGGVVHVGPIDAANPNGSVSARANYDLRSQDLAIRATFAAPVGGKYWSGPPPSFAVAVSGPVDAPARQIDAAGLAAGLAAQAIARDTDRIDALEADIRERAFFNRRMKAEQFMRRREQELADYEADQARIKSEQDRKRVEDGLLKASEERQKANAPAPAAPATAVPVAPAAAAPAATPASPPHAVVSGAPQTPAAGETTAATAPPPLPPVKPKAESVDPTASGFY